MKKQLVKNLVVGMALCTISTQIGVTAMAETHNVTSTKNAEILKLNDLSHETFDLKSEENRVHMQNQGTKSGENWVLEGNPQVLKSNVILSSKYGDIVAKDVTKSKTSTFNLSVSGNKVLHGVTLSGSGGFSQSKTHTFFGPRGNVALANNSKNGYLTHNVSVGIIKGDIKRYTYKVYDKYSGHYLRTEVKTNAIKKEIFSYTLGVQELGSTRVEKANGISFETYNSFSIFRNTVNIPENAAAALY